VNVGIRHKSKIMQAFSTSQLTIQLSKMAPLTGRLLMDGVTNDDTVVATMMKGLERPRP